MLSKQEVANKIKAETGLDIESGGRLIVKVIDYSGNPLAPEKYAYKVFYTCPFSSRREKFIYYPETVGMQFLK